MNKAEIIQKYKDNVYYKRSPEMFMQLVMVVMNNKDTYMHKMKAPAFISLKRWICDQMKFLDHGSFYKADYPMKEMVYLVLHGMEDFPKCVVCGKPLDDPKAFRSIVSGFSQCCSKQCSKASRVNSFRATSLKTYGATHPLKSKTGLQHYCDTLEKHHGVRNPFQLEKSKAQIKATKKKNYGNENYVNVEKARQTRHQRFDGQWEGISTKRKRKETFMLHYGTDNNMKSEAGLKEYCASVEKRHGKGVTNPSQVPEVRCKQRSKYKYDSCSFDSAPELAFYIWLKDTGIEFQYKPKMFFTYEADGASHRYFPDFKIGDMVFELKGDQFFDEHGVMQNPYDHLQDTRFAAKQKCMLQNNVIVLKSSEYCMFEEYVAQKYGCGYLKQFKTAHCKDVTTMLS